MTDFPRPSVPVELWPTVVTSEFADECDKLWLAVVTELQDEDYYWQSHYKRHTFDQGCRGPLCQKYVRDASRSRPRSTKMYRPREEHIYDPIIDYFKIIATMRLAEIKRELQLKGTA